MTLFEEFCHRIDEKFVVLSPAARSELKGMIHAMAADAYERGVEAGKQRSKQEVDDR